MKPYPSRSRSPRRSKQRMSKASAIEAANIRCGDGTVKVLDFNL